MRTIEELKEYLNPTGKLNGHWMHVIVSYEAAINNGVGLHEIYFEKDGSIMGAHKEPESATGNDQEDLILGLKQMLASAEKGLTITNMELTAIHNQPTNWEEMEQEVLRIVEDPEL